ncbi:MAG: hypothetical protein ACP5I8_05420 [Phycisphaerae bacterium]
MVMRIHKPLLFTLMAVVALCVAAVVACNGKSLPAPRMSYLDNGQLRVGVNLAMGGAITYLAQSGGKMNLINHVDLGREIQMSDYSGPNPYIPPGRKIRSYWRMLGWNPVQAGDAFKNPSKIVYFRNNGSSLVVRSIPMIWPLNNQPARCSFQTRITLQGDTAHVRCRMVVFRRDLKQYSARPQECPALYTVGKLWRLVAYTGDRPFTNAPVTMLDPPVVLKRKMQVFAGTRKGDPWIAFNATENWAALVNNAGFGLGIWAPGDYRFSGGFYGAVHGTGGPTDSQTGYIAPNFFDIIDHNIVYKYRYVLIVGSIGRIRSWVYKHAPRPGLPQWKFTRDRQHWGYVDAHDTGWPIKGCLNVSLTGAHPRLVGPDWFWRASKAPVLFIDAAFKTTAKVGAVWWRGLNENGFSPRSRVVFPINGDGHYHRYAIRLAGNKAYRGAMAQLRIDPVPAGESGAWVKIKSIGFLRRTDDHSHHGGIKK